MHFSHVTKVYVTSIRSQCGYLVTVLNFFFFWVQYVRLSDVGPKKLAGTGVVGIMSACPQCVLFCFIEPKVKKIRNNASSCRGPGCVLPCFIKTILGKCPGIFSRTLHVYYVASSTPQSCPTHSIIYVHFLVTRSQKIILHFIQYKWLNLVRRIRRSKIWSSAHEYAALI